MRGEVENSPPPPPLTGESVSAYRSRFYLSRPMFVGCGGGYIKHAYIVWRIRQGIAVSVDVGVSTFSTLVIFLSEARP